MSTCTRQHIPGGLLRGRTRYRLVRISDDVGKTNPLQQARGRLLSELERLVLDPQCRPVVRLERINTVQAKLRAALCVRSHLMDTAQAHPLAWITGVEAD
jgi:hypothetical protein